MTTPGQPDHEPPVRRSGHVVAAALAVFVAIGALPAILSALHLSRDTAPPTSSDGVRLLPAPPPLSSIPLPVTAEPVRPEGPVATLPRVSQSRETTAVGVQDDRLRMLLHDSFRFARPRVVRSPGELPTLVLTGGPRDILGGAVLVGPPVSYTVADLALQGALVRLRHGVGLLRYNVFVAAGARLTISSSAALRVLHLKSTPHRYVSIIGWGGGLRFAGARHRPLTIEGWRQATAAPAFDQGNGRPYIREVGGRMTLAHARVSALGFWSGRTGGVAWTGLAHHPSTGHATDSSFTGDTYGGFVTRGQDVRFTGDLFESSQLDGLHIHRSTTGASVTLSAAVRNGANGFRVDRATRQTKLAKDLSQHNGANGFLVDGRPLVGTASASGDGVAPGAHTTIEHSAALGNGRTGILVEGGTRTLLKANEVCARHTGIALRLGASQAIVNGNNVRCGPRVGLWVGPSAPRSLLSGNAVSGARIGILVTNSGHAEISGSRISQATVFGITVRGLSSTVTGQQNVITGTGFRAIDARADARPPKLAASNTSGWLYRKKVTVWSYLEFHPLAILWLTIFGLVAFGALWSRRRRLPSHPYLASTSWIVPELTSGPSVRALTAASESTPWLVGRAAMGVVPYSRRTGSDGAELHPVSPAGQDAGASTNGSPHRRDDQT